MYFRDVLFEILIVSSATGSGAVSGNDPDGILPSQNMNYFLDPHVLQSDATARTPAASSTPNLKPAAAYNKSKKRVRIELSDDEDAAPAAKKVDTKVDLGVAISNLTAEMGRTRKAKEKFMTNQQKAVRLLEDGLAQWLLSRRVPYFRMWGM
jgi:hypothetical protein